jgi:hypothetical protein
MKIGLDLSALGKTKWYEYALRLAFGGSITVAAGLLAKQWGPGVGGLFLAFPAIFPASATLIEKHEKKNSNSLDGTVRGREAAGLDAAGAAIGSIGLIALLSPYGAYASSIDVAGHDLRYARLAHNLRRDLVSTEDARGAQRASLPPSRASRTVSQRERYATMRFADSPPLPACSAKLFCSCPAFPTSSARAAASAFPRTVLKPFALKTAECYMPAMISPR